MRKPKGFTPDGDDSFSRQGGGNLLESSFFPAFKNVFLCGLGVLSDQRERAVHDVPTLIWPSTLGPDEPFYHEVSNQEIREICTENLGDIEAVLGAVKQWIAKQEGF